MKTKAFTACVRPILEYAAVCWSPSSDKLKHKIEMVQHKATKFVTNIYPKKGHYEEFSIQRIIKSLGWESLEERRNKIRLNMVYKILNNQVIYLTVIPYKSGHILYGNYYRKVTAVTYGT